MSEFKFDRYKLFETFLWGAVSVLHPHRKILRPQAPQLSEEFEIGVWCARNGYVELRADADPKEIVARKKRDHELRRQERLASISPIEREAGP